MPAFSWVCQGITLVAAVSSALWELSGRDVPFAYNRKEAKDHGEGGVVVGADMKVHTLTHPFSLTTSHWKAAFISCLDRH